MYHKQHISQYVKSWLMIKVFKFFSSAQADCCVFSLFICKFVELGCPLKLDHGLSEICLFVFRSKRHYQSIL